MNENEGGNIDANGKEIKLKEKELILGLLKIENDRFKAIGYVILVIVVYLTIRFLDGKTERLQELSLGIYLVVIFLSVLFIYSFMRIGRYMEFIESDILKDSFCKFLKRRLRSRF